MASETWSQILSDDNRVSDGLDASTPRSTSWTLTRVTLADGLGGEEEVARGQSGGDSLSVASHCERGGDGGWEDNNFSSNSPNFMYTPAD